MVNKKFLPQNCFPFLSSQKSQTIFLINLFSDPNSSKQAAAFSYFEIQTVITLFQRVKSSLPGIFTESPPTAPFQCRNQACCQSISSPNRCLAELEFFQQIWTGLWTVPSVSSQPIRICMPLPRFFFFVWKSNLQSFLLIIGTDHAELLVSLLKPGMPCCLLFLCYSAYLLFQTELIPSSNPTA